MKKYGDMYNNLSNKSKGLFLVIIGNIIASFDSLLVRLADVSGWDTVFWFGLFTFLVLGVYSFKRSENIIILAKEIKSKVILSAILVSASLLFFIQAVKLTHVANAAVIMSSAPIFAAIFSLIILKEKTRKSTFLVILVTIVGLIVVVFGSLGKGNIVGDSFALISAAIASLNFTLWRKYPSTNKMLSMSLGGFLLVLVSMWYANPFTLDPVSYVYLIIMGVITAPWGRLASGLATKYLPVAEVSMYKPLNTVLAPIWVWLVLGEKPFMATFIGGGIIIVSLMLYTIYSSKSKKINTFDKENSAII